MPQIENKWSVQGVATLLGIVLTLAAILGIAYNEGRQREALERRVSTLETQADQAALDSRTLIEVRLDVAYIKRFIENMERQQSVGFGSVHCPTDAPVLVASYCRGMPSGD